MKYFTASIAALMVAAIAPSRAADHARARELYAQICVACHGPDMDGGKGPALKDAYWRHGDSPEAILKVINEGVQETEMVPFREALPESDRIALRDFILSEQEGLRGVVRKVYPRAPLNGKRLTPGLFDAVEPLVTTPLPENVYYFDRDQDGVLRGVSQLHVKAAGTYRFSVRPVGRTSIYVNGREVHYSDEKADKKTHLNESFTLAPGVHRLEVLHEERNVPTLRFNAFLEHESGRKWALHGRSLQGSVPRIVVAEPEAKVVRKLIDGLPPRTLLCLLPNQVLVAYQPQTSEILSAWHSASIDQTPSLSDRSTKPSEIKGTPIPRAAPAALKSEALRFLRYEMRGEVVRIVSLVDGQERVLSIAPDGSQSFKVSLQ